jgi:uncharacterized protein (DUF433 family)
MVELLQRYARSPIVVSQLRQTLIVARKRPKRAERTTVQPHRPHAVRQRLGSETVQELITAYREGVTTPELVTRYGIAKSAVLGILHDEGMAIRKPGLTAAQVTEATELRGQSVSYDTIGQRFDVYGSTVWRALNPARPGRQVQHRLQPAEIADLLDAYQQGSGATELAERYAINRATVLEHIRRAAIEQRSERFKLSEEQVTEAIELYAKGWSTIRLGEHFGVDDCTIRSALIRVGAVLRARAGWKE